MARGNGTTGTALLSDAGRAIAAQLSGGRCPCCRRPMILWGADRATRLTIDHVLPHALGGGVEGNLVPLCGSCNFSKQDTPIEEWLPARLAEIRGVSRVMTSTWQRRLTDILKLRDALTAALENAR